MVGILPTLEAEDLQLAALSDAPRYRALNNGLRRLRQEPFRIRIHGADPLELAADDVGLEGANTSFQVHLRVDPDRFSDHFNAAQLAIGPVLAVAGNSPTFLGHRLWQETPVALFKQAVDDRDATGRSSRRLSRVAFGTGWTRGGPLELLEESVRLHEPVLPVVGAEQPLDRLGEDEGAGVPALEELRLHQGTVWRWNHHNFYRAAQFGLGAELAWPPDHDGRSWSLPATELVREPSPPPARAWSTPGWTPRRRDRC